MKLSKELYKLKTLANMDDLCNSKIEAITRSDLVENIKMCNSNISDTYTLTISAQINPKSTDSLKPILLNFQFEIIDLYYYRMQTDPTQLDYNLLLCPPNCECCKPKFWCKDKCPCD